MIPVSANAETEDTDTVSVSGIETDFGDTASGDPDERDIDSEVAEHLSNGDYVEGRATVLYDTESTASGEELVEAGSLIGSAEQIAEVSAESYVNVTGETLEMSGEELVGASSESPDDRIAVLAVEDQSRSTEEILRGFSLSEIWNDYIDEDDQVTNQYRVDLANNTLAPVLDSCKEIADGVHALIQGIYDENALKGMITDGNKPKVYENPLNDNFYKKEFQTLWGYINHKYAYTVEYDSEELIRKAIAHIDDRMVVARLQYTVTYGEQMQEWDSDKLKRGEAFVAEKSRTHELQRAEGSLVPYDLVGKVAEGCKLTRRTVARILGGISPFKFAMFRNNPEEFITKAIRLINEQKATMIVEHITYDKIEGSYDSSIFTAEKNKDFAGAYRAKKSIQDFVFTDGYAQDGQSKERVFVQDLDIAEEVCVYAKLPKGFSIPTPVGNYSPDWAIAFHKGSVKHIFFVAETKGTMDTLQLKPIEKAKIDCAKKLFNECSTEDVVYHQVDSYENLLKVMESL